MANPDIAFQRLHSQHLSRPTFNQPDEVVRWLGAVQAQDYLGALWAVGLRMRQATEKTVEQAIAERRIVRTWPMRGTLHFVAPEDAGWMLKLLTPRVIARSAGRYRQLELDDAVFSRSRDIIVHALQGGKQLTRKAIGELLEAAGIPTTGGRALHILSRHAQDGVICFGAREGKQPTFALLEEWAPSRKALERDQALAELAERYFTSHGPATVQDFMWWSGLTAANARAGLELAKARLIREVIDGQTYWRSSSAPPGQHGAPVAHLLPAFDEYTVAYKDRGAVTDPAHALESQHTLSPTIVVDGQLVGNWQRTLKKGSVVITPSYFAERDEAASHAVAAAAGRYGGFLGASVDVR
jgi:winged helix DNA-binding protein